MERYLGPIAILIVGYLAYDYFYDFQKSPSSPLVTAQAQLEQIKQASKGLEVKIKQAEEFNRTLEQKVAELRLLSAQLDEFKVTLSEDFDTGLFGTLANESRRAGVQVSNFTKQATRKTEYYDEASYRISFSAVYVQLFVFLERLSKLDKIVRLSSVTLRPVASDNSDSPYVELKGELKLNTYRYNGSEADKLTPGQAPAKPAPAAAKGGKA